MRGMNLSALSLRRKFAIAFVAFSLLLTVGGGMLALQVTSRALESELDEKLLWMAGATAGAALPGGETGFIRGDEVDRFWLIWQERLRAFLPYVEEAYIFHEEGYVQVSTLPASDLPIGTPLTALFAFPSALAEAWESGQATTELFRGDDGTLYKYAFHRLDQSDSMLGLLVRTDFLDPVLALRRSIFIGSLLAAFLAAVLAYLLAAGVSGPVERLSRSALRIQRGQWDRPVVEEGGSEVGRLSRAMERMRLGILQRDEQLRLMLAQVAHEIRNPLGGLELFASAAMESDDPDERRRILGRIRKEVESLNGIIQDFLSFARPMEPQAVIHDLREPLREASELLQMELGGNGGRLQVDLPGEPIQVRADPDHVKRIVLNLLRNGAHAGRHVHLSAHWHNGEAVITVSDDGEGVPREMRERIFEPFVTDKEQGAGLGLAIVDRLSRVNGGRIELSDPENDGAEPWPEDFDGAGARFRVYLQGSDELPLDLD
ncbi:MAG: sensor histidine kinase [Gemmatimonadales bacterium]|nr:MAG: sensor histidine kinase [Gemmatimonadales bacterium]